MDFAVPMDLKVKIKESEKRYKYLNLARELKLWNTKVTVILNLICALGTIPKGLIRELEELEIKGLIGII